MVNVTYEIKVGQTIFIGDVKATLKQSSEDAVKLSFDLESIKYTQICIKEESAVSR